MRILAFFMSILVMFMAAYPCADRIEDVSPSQSIISMQVESGDHHHGDECTPFCACSCCATIVILEVGKVTTSADNSFPERDYLHYLNPHTQSVIASIWQPPRPVNC